MEQLQATADAERLDSREYRALIDGGRPGRRPATAGGGAPPSPPSPQLAELAARLAMREGRVDLALLEMDEAVAQASRNMPDCTSAAPMSACRWMTGKAPPRTPRKP